MNVLPLTHVFLKCEPVCRLGKRIPCFIQVSFLRCLFFHSQDIANEFCFKSLILKESSILDLDDQKLN